MPKNTKTKQSSQEIPKFIIHTSKVFSLISKNLATWFAAKLFTTPIRHKLPKREIVMDQKSVQQTFMVKSIQKEIVVYEYGKSDRKIILVHGWSGRGTQLVKIADELLKFGFMTVSFDAPSHGKSKGSSTIMTEFIASILEIEKQYGPFEYAIGHSLGGMSILNAVSQKLNIKKAVIIGSGDIIQDIIDDFIKKIALRPKYGILLKNYFERKFVGNMDDYSAYNAAKNVNIPILIIHDEDDDDVPVKAALNIHKHLIDSELMITKGLGHRKILGNDDVIQKIKSFLDVNN